MNDGLVSYRLDSGVQRGEPVEIIFDGQTVKAYKGETIATALMAAGHLSLGTSFLQPRGVYCNIGVCHSCVMTVNGIRSVRICKTLVFDGCRVESQQNEKGL
jgi:sarcosine oxidase subunit alpha